MSDEAPKDAESTEEAKAPKLAGAAKDAVNLIESEDAVAKLQKYGDQMLATEKSTVATHAARVVHEVIQRKPEIIVSLVERFGKGITSDNKRVVQTCSDGLPAITKVAPAKVAKQLDLLRAAFEPASATGRDGLVRTFAGLCRASVAYQKRLEPILTTALESADGKTLRRWCEIVLPALKGEPHARAREVVENRLERIPRADAQDIANFLGIRLRVRYR